MAFSDNPFVSSLMQETGLNNLMSMGGAPPAPAGGPPSASPIGGVQSHGAPHSPQPIPESRIARPPVNPRWMGPVGGNPMGGFFHSPAAQAGLMSGATLHSPMVRDYLAANGVTAPDDIDDHLFVHDPKAFAKHPMIASMIENGLTGLANYHTGQDTAGTLSNIAGSVLDANAAHAQAYNARAMAPLMQAQAVAGLRGQQTHQDFETAQAKKDNAMGDYYSGLNASRETIGAAHDAVNQDKANNSPGALQRQIEEAHIQRIIGPNRTLDSATPEERIQGIREANQQGSADKATGAVAVQTTKNQGTAAAATIRANAPKRGGTKVDPLDKANYGELLKQHQDLTKRVNDIDSDKPMTDEMGLPMSNSQRQAVKAQLIQKAAQLTNQKAALEVKYGGKKQNAPQQSSSDSAVTHIWVPGKGLQAVGK